MIAASFRVSPMVSFTPVHISVENQFSIRVAWNPASRCQALHAHQGTNQFSSDPQSAKLVVPPLRAANGKASAQEPATVGAFDLRFSDTRSDERMTALRTPRGRGPNK